ncbi:MAG: CvpA family protein [Cyclobacteriaceae bacterium]
MSKVDIVLAIILALGAYLGYRRGFLMELFFLLSIVLGIFVSFKLMRWGMEILQREFNADKTFLPYISFAIIFILVMVLVIFFGRRIKNLIDTGFLGKVDSLAGALLGMIKYAFCLSVIIWLAESLKIKFPESWNMGSQLYPLTAKFAHHLSGFLGSFIPFFKEIFGQL